MSAFDMTGLQPYPQPQQVGAGGGGPQDMRRRLAAQLLQQGSSAEPVQHWAQGAARVAQALMGGLEMGSADVQERNERKALATAMMEATTGQGEGGVTMGQGGRASAVARILGSPYATPGQTHLAQQYGAPQTYGFQNVQGLGLVRTSPRTGQTELTNAVPDAPTVVAEGSAAFNRSGQMIANNPALRVVAPGATLVDTGAIPRAGAPLPSGPAGATPQPGMPQPQGAPAPGVPGPGGAPMQLTPQQTPQTAMAPPQPQQAGGIPLPMPNPERPQPAGGIAPAPGPQGAPAAPGLQPPAAAPGGQPAPGRPGVVFEGQQPRPLTAEERTRWGIAPIERDPRPYAMSPEGRPQPIDGYTTPPPESVENTTRATANAQMLTGLGGGFATARQDRFLAERLNQLSENVNPGTRTALLEAIRQRTGIELDPNASNVQAFSTLTSYLAPHMRVPGSGTTSDRDLSTFQASLPSLLGTAEGNRMAVETIGGMARYREQTADIGARYAMQQITSREAHEELRRLESPFAGFRAWQEQQARARTEGQGGQQQTGQTGQQQAPQQPAAPAVDEIRVHEGVRYRFRGGSPADQNSWERAQ